MMLNCSIKVIRSRRRDPFKNMMVQDFVTAFGAKKPIICAVGDDGEYDIFGGGRTYPSTYCCTGNSMSISIFLCNYFT